MKKIYAALAAFAMLLVMAMPANAGAGTITNPDTSPPLIGGYAMGLDGCAETMHPNVMPHPAAYQQVWCQSNGKTYALTNFTTNTNRNRYIKVMATYHGAPPTGWFYRDDKFVVETVEHMTKAQAQALVALYRHGSAQKYSNFA